MFGSDDEEEEKDLSEGVQRPLNCGVLSFHSGTEEALLLHVQRHLSLPTKEDDKEEEASSLGGRVLRLIDCFCYSRHWMMHIGDQKGAILSSCLRQITTHPSSSSSSAACSSSSSSSVSKGKVVLELGCYCGYSSILISNHLQPESDLLISVDINEKCIQWTRNMLHLADIHHVLLLHGDIKTLIPQILSILKERNKPFLDLLFIDHDKSLYKKDLLVIESHHLLGPGTVVVADNVLSFSTPLGDYLNYVRQGEGGSFASSICYPSRIEYALDDDDGHGANDGDVSLVDGVEVSVYR